MSELGERVTKLAFEERGADYLLAMREEHGNVAPILLPKGEPLGEIRTDIPYQLVTILTKIYPWIRDGKIAIITRRCDEKAINELVKRDIFDRNRIIPIGLACDEEQVRQCRCDDPIPSNVDIGEAQKGIASDDLVEQLLKVSPEDRFKFWIDQFKKCNKCYACSGNCPVCVCDYCVLEECNFVPERGIPPGLAFHMIRSFHLADKCIECGECERACPANIPLLTLRKMTRRDMIELFDYLPGHPEKISPLLTTLDDQSLEDDSIEY